MPAVTARALSLGLVGGIMAVLFYTQALVPWAAFVAWASFLAAGGDTPALKQTITGNLLGVVIGWLTLVLITIFIRVPSGSWLWMPRTGLVIGLGLVVVGMVSGSKSAGSSSAGLLGFATLIGVTAGAVPAWVTGQPLTALRLHNPGIATLVSMVGGALFAFLASRLASRLAKA